MTQRMLAFGCSFTYGHGLNDCIGPYNQPGSNPSKLAWPTLLADKVGAQCINLSDPGASNKEIWNKIVSTDFTTDDVVVVLWSYVDRWSVITDEGVDPINPWNRGKRSKSFYRLLYNNHDMQIDLNMRMHHSFLLLRDLGIPSYHCIVSPSEFIREDWNDVPLTSSSMDLYRRNNPKANDRQHPGPKAHEMFAEELYNKITEKK